MDHGTFGTAFNCIDGRAQGAVSDWVKQNLGVDFVDTVTAAGMDRLMNDSEETIKDIKRYGEISVTKHGSKHVVIAGHYDCAGNPVSDDEHKEHIRQAVEKICSWSWPIEVAGLWVNSDWQIERVV